MPGAGRSFLLCRLVLSVVRLCILNGFQGFIFCFFKLSTTAIQFFRRSYRKFCCTYVCCTPVTERFIIRPVGYVYNKNQFVSQCYVACKHSLSWFATICYISRTLPALCVSVLTLPFSCIGTSNVSDCYRKWMLHVYVEMMRVDTLGELYLVSLLTLGHLCICRQVDDVMLAT